jgi:hypothetical protein
VAIERRCRTLLALVIVGCSHPSLTPEQSARRSQKECEDAAQADPFAFALDCTHAAPIPSAPQPDCGVEVQPEALPEPLLVFLELNPRLWVIGSDVPSLVIYANGDVVHAVRNSDGFPTEQFQRGHLSAGALSEVLRSLSLDLLAGLDARLASTNASDARTSVIVWWSADKRHLVSFYGPAARTAQEGRLAPTAAPGAFVDVYEQLVAFKLQGAQPYEPKVIELMMDPTESPAPIYQWPPEWPGFDAYDGLRPRRTPDHVGRIYMRSSCLSAVANFAQTLRPQHGVVLLDGHKFHLQGVRYTLPNEHMWIRDLPQGQ